MRARSSSIRGIIHLGLGVGLMVPSLVAGQDGDAALLGAWEGTLDAGAAQLPLVFHITQDEDGSLAATMDSPAQGAFGIGVDSVTIEGSQVSLGIEAIAGGFTGTLSEDATTIEGTWSQGPASLPLTLTR